MGNQSSGNYGFGTLPNMDPQQRHQFLQQPLDRLLDPNYGGEQQYAAENAMNNDPNLAKYLGQGARGRRPLQPNTADVWEMQRQMQAARMASQPQIPQQAWSPHGQQPDILAPYVAPPMAPNPGAPINPGPPLAANAPYVVQPPMRLQPPQGNDPRFQVAQPQMDLTASAPRMPQYQQPQQAYPPDPGQYAPQQPAPYPAYPQAGMPGFDPSQSSTADPRMQQMMRDYFMGSMGANQAAMTMGGDSLRAGARNNSIGNFFGNLSGMANGAMGMRNRFSDGGARAQAQYANMRKDDQQQFGNTMAFGQHAAGNAQQAMNMMIASDPNQIKNQIAMMNAAAGMQRAQYYGQSVASQDRLGQGKLNQGWAQLAQNDSHFAVTAGQAQQRLLQDNMRIAQEGQRLGQSQQQIDETIRHNNMQFDQQMQGMANQYQIAQMNNSTSMYNAGVNQQGQNYRDAAGLVYDKDGNPHPKTADWFNQANGAPAPVTAAAQPDPMQQVMSWFTGQPAQAAPPAVAPPAAAPAMPRSAPAAPPPSAVQFYQQNKTPQMRQAFIQKYGIDPGA